jgi:hypothetical protein
VCNKILTRCHASTHYKEQHSSNIKKIQQKKRDHEDVNEMDKNAWDDLWGTHPMNFQEPTMENMGTIPCHINGNAMLVRPQTLELLKSLLPDVEISILDPQSQRKRAKSNESSILGTHSNLELEQIQVIESGGTKGLEVITGAVLITGSKKMTVICTEIYSRDPILDSHAESKSTSSSSSPNTAPTTQYAARLKIVKIPDAYSHNKLVIGVSSYNYLITAGILDDKEALIGPGRCSLYFPVDHTTKIYINKNTPAPDQSIYSTLRSLAQVRSNFGNITTYTARRTAMIGYAAPEYMPITVFTLAESGVHFSKIFYNLANRVRQRGLNHTKVSLKLSDIEKPLENEKSELAIVTRDIIKLFGEKKKLLITGNSELENMLTKLANLLSSIISDKNRTVARNIRL